MVTAIPTLAQSCAVAELVRRGELTDEHCYLIAHLLDEIGTSVRVAVEVARKYPDDSAAQDLATRPIWEPVGTTTSDCSTRWRRWPEWPPRSGPAGVIPLAGPSAVHHGPDGGHFR